MLSLFSDPTFLQIAVPATIGAVTAGGGGAAIVAHAKKKRAEKKEERKFAGDLWEEAFYGWREWLQAVVSGTSTETTLQKAQGIRRLFETSQEWLPDHAVDYRNEGRLYLTYYPSMMGDHFLKMVPVGVKASKIESSMNGSFMWTRNHWDMVISYLEVIPEWEKAHKLLDEYVVATAAQLLLNYRFSPKQETEHTSEFIDQAVKRQRELRFLWKKVKPAISPWTEASRLPSVSVLEQAKSLQLDRNPVELPAPSKAPARVLPPHRKSKMLTPINIPRGEMNDEEYSLATRFIEGAEDLGEEKVVSGNSLLQKLAGAANAEKEAESFTEPVRSQVIGLAQKNRQTALTGLLALLGDDLSKRESELLKSLRVDEKYLDAKMSSEEQ